MKMNTWGHILKLSIFGESHGQAIGIMVDGLPPGENICLKQIQTEMQRRAPGLDSLATARREADEVNIVSGIMNGRTTGAPICGLITNSDTRSGDYSSTLRPGHADWAARLKYGDHVDLRGGGHFSGRLTAPLVFAGALAKQVLERHGIFVHGRIAALAGIKDMDQPVSLENRKAIAAKTFPVSNDAAAEEMKLKTLEAKKEGDSVGGIIEAVAFGVPGGLGEPFFGSVESSLSSLLFSIPGIKGVEFGEGFKFADLKGSEANDELGLADGCVAALSNHNGGILGGISNGLPLIVKAAVKPTPSIAKEQRSVDHETKTETMLSIKGRHDPAIVPRAVPVVEAAMALCLLDLALVAGKVTRCAISS